MAALSTTQQAKQGARHIMAVGADKLKLAGGQLGRGETMVRPCTKVHSNLPAHACWCQTEDCKYHFVRLVSAVLCQPVVWRVLRSLVSTICAQREPLAAEPAYKSCVCAQQQPAATPMTAIPSESWPSSCAGAKTTHQTRCLCTGA